MTHACSDNRKKLEQNRTQEDQILRTTASTICNAGHEQQEEEGNQPMVTPKRTTYLSNDGDYSPDETKLPYRVLSTQSLLGLVGLEGHEESEEDFSTTGISAVTEEQEVMDIMVSPTTPASPSEGYEIEDATCNTTPPGSVQGPGILSLSPPRLTTYSTGSVNSASVTESFVLQPRPVQSMQRQNHLLQESPRFPRSPLVQQPQLQPRSRPPRAPHHPSTIPGGSNSVGGGPVHLPRAASGAGPESLYLSGTGASGGGHTRTATDATNYSFLSSLTDVSGGELSAPRRRTMSWDNNENLKRKGSASDSKSLGGASASGSILQPILLPEDMDSAARPPMSISASNLRKVLPVVPGPTATTPILLRNTASTPLLAPSSLPSRENLHPLIQTLQNISRGQSTPFTLRASQSKDDANLHPPQDSSASKSGHTVSTPTSATSPFTVHLQDEKKDDDSSRSLPLLRPNSLQERKTSDYGSYASSFCSSTTIRMQKTTINSPGDRQGAFERRTSPQRIRESGAIGDSKHAEVERFDLADIVNATKECSMETELIDGIERKSLIKKGEKSCSDDSFSDWPYVLLAWGILNLGSRRFVLNASSEVMKNIFVSNEFILLCLGLGAATIVKRNLSKKFFDRQVMGHYRDELSMLRNIWVLLSKIAALPTKEGEDNSDETENCILQFRNICQCIDNKKESNFASSFGELGMTRENFIESSQFVYERLARRNGEVELTFQSICEVTKLPDGSIDRRNVKILSELFRPLRQSRVSKFDFVKSTDRMFKTTNLSIANIQNAHEICQDIDRIVNVIFYAMAAILVPSVFGAHTKTLALTLLGMSFPFTFIFGFMSFENLKGMIRLTTQKSYNIGDRVCFVNPDDTETKVGNGPPSGGWIVEKFDLYTTTVRHGITGERNTLANGSPFLMNSRVVNWKRSHRAIVKLSMDFDGKTGSDKIDFFRRQISEWIEDRPREWIHLDAFRMVDVDIHQQRVRYDVILRHRESWCDYAAVQDSKSDILVFLHELQIRNSVKG